MIIAVVIDVNLNAKGITPIYRGSVGKKPMKISLSEVFSCFIVEKMYQKRKTCFPLDLCSVI